MGMSYLVGYGATYPQHVHHRGASIVAYRNDTTFVSCNGGYQEWYASKSSNPNVVVGAIVGEPNSLDVFLDSISQFEQSEPTISTIGPFVGVLARFASIQNDSPNKTSSSSISWFKYSPLLLSPFLPKYISLNYKHP